MTWLEDLRRRHPRKAACPLYLRSQLEAWKAMMAEPSRWSVETLKPIAAAMDEIEAELASRPAVDPAALMIRAKARALELGVGA